MTNSPFPERRHSYRTPNSVFRPTVPTRSEIVYHFRSAYYEIESFRNMVCFDNVSHQKRSDGERLYHMSGIALTSSAFDHFMHEILYLTFIWMKDGKIPKSKIYIDEVDNADRYDSSSSLGKFLNRLEMLYGRKTLSSSRYWSDAITSMGLKPEEIAGMVMDELGIHADGNMALTRLISEFNRFAKRRNEIVHNYDTPVFGIKANIVRSDMEEYMRFFFVMVKCLDRMMDRDLKA